jgi:hypothetical protein
MSVCTGIFAVSCSREQPKEAMTLQRERQLNQFLAGVERRALRFAEIAVRDRDEALDLVPAGRKRNGRRFSIASCRTGFVTGIAGRWSGTV